MYVGNILMFYPPKKCQHAAKCGQNILGNLRNKFCVLYNGHAADD